MVVTTELNKSLDIGRGTFQDWLVSPRLKVYPLTITTTPGTLYTTGGMTVNLKKFGAKKIQQVLIAGRNSFGRALNFNNDKLIMYNNGAQTAANTSIAGKVLDVIVIAER